MVTSILKYFSTKDLREYFSVSGLSPQGLPNQEI